MKHDLLHIQGKPFVLIPLHEYREMTTEKAAHDNSLPEEILNELVAGEASAIKVLRMFKNMTQVELAAAAGLSRPYLTEIETGVKQGSIKALRAIAQALGVDMRYLMSGN